MSKWTELEPKGPRRDWADHDRTKCGQAWSRKWVKPHPSEPAWSLTVEMSAWPCQGHGRRWFVVEHRFELWRGHPDQHDADPIENFPIKQSAPGEHTDLSQQDAPASEEWPTDRDIRRELERVREPAPWNGDW